MGRKLRLAKAQTRPASPYIALKLATGQAPLMRVRGWVCAEMTNGADNLSEAELIARYVDSLRADCEGAGFTPHCDVPLTKQSPAARQAAAEWAQQVTAEGSY